MSNLNAIESFADKLNKITDEDFGDFRRKAQSYLNNLKKEVQGTNQDFAQKVLKIESLLSYQGDERDVDQTLMEIKTQIDSLKS